MSDSLYKYTSYLQAIDPAVTMHRALIVSEPEPHAHASMKNTFVVVQRSPLPTGTLQIVESKPATLGR